MAKTNWQPRTWIIFVEYDSEHKTAVTFTGKVKDRDAIISRLRKAVKRDYPTTGKVYCRIGNSAEWLADLLEAHYELLKVVDPNA